MINLSIIKSDKIQLSKTFSLVDNELKKKTSGNLQTGTIQRIKIPFTDLEDRLQQLKSYEAVTWGVSEKNGTIAADYLAKEGDVIRNRKHFSYPANAILMIDFDNVDFSFDDAREMLIQQVSALKDAPMLIRSTSSSHIYHKENRLTKSGIRVLIPVKNGADIPRFGDVLFKLFWLNGHGHIQVSKSGAALVRTHIDASVWQPERLDFCAKAIINKPLTQKAPESAYYNSENAYFCTDLVTIPPTQERKYQKLVNEARASKKEQLEEAKLDWKRERIADVLQKAVEKKPEITIQEQQEIRRKYSNAIDTESLTGDFILHTQDGTAISVEDLLNDKEKYHQTRFHDPIEYNYRNDSRIAYANLRAAVPYVFSHAHGGKRYKLFDKKITIELVSGKRSESIVQAIAALNKTDNYYERMSELVRVTESGDVVVQDFERVKNALDETICFLRFTKDGFQAQDCPDSIAKGVLASTQIGHFRELDTVATQAVFDARVEEVASKNGYHDGVLIRSDEEYNIPENPTQKDVEIAMETIKKPIEHFPFASDRDRAVMLSAMLTAVVRSTLPTAPAFLMTAPSIGSGKTLLTHIIAALSSHKRPKLISELKDQNSEEELRKILTSVARESGNAIIFDNVNGYFSSNTLCSYLTEKYIDGRVLGQSKMIDIRTNNMILISGNNTTLKGDMCRRTLTVTIDPKMEKPWMRKFDIDPVFWVKKNRVEIVTALLTVLRYGTQSGYEMDSRTASFESWSDTVRKTVKVVTGIDIVDSINANVENDPEVTKLASFLEIVKEKQEKDWTVADLMKKSEMDSELRETIGDVSMFNSRIFGSWLSKNAGREIDGMRLDKTGKRHKVLTWKVVVKEDVQCDFVESEK